MKTFNYSTALNALKLDKQPPRAVENLPMIPKQFVTKDFIERFLPFVKILGDSREQDKWVEQYCNYYNINFEWCVKDEKKHTENLKEGDYTFEVIFGNKIYSYRNKVAYERKGSVSEFYNNCMKDRDRVKREFERFNAKQYEKVVLMLEFGNRIDELINLEYGFYQKGENGKPVKKQFNVGNTIYSTIQSWKQPNGYAFEVIMNKNKTMLFWLVLQDMFYYFRNEIREECRKKGLIENEN